VDWWGELGQGRDGGGSYGHTRQDLLEATSVTEEIGLKTARAYGPRGLKHSASMARLGTTISERWSQAASTPTCARGHATLEICLATLEAAKTGQGAELTEQV
jgi:hypothetical protein